MDDKPGMVSGKALLRSVSGKRLSTPNLAKKVKKGKQLEEQGVLGALKRTREIRKASEWEDEGGRVWRSQICQAMTTTSTTAATTQIMTTRKCHGRIRSAVRGCSWPASRDRKEAVAMRSLWGQQQG